MDRFPTELIYVLIFAAIVLFQYLVKRFAPQEHEQEQQQESAQDEQAAQYEEEARPVQMPFPVVDVATSHFGRSAAPVVSPAPSRRRFSRSSLMGTRRKVQDAIVIATILGPCRAFEPHDSR
jgi:hypothetical protein